MLSVGYYMNEKQYVGRKGSGVCDVFDVILYQMFPHYSASHGTNFAFISAFAGIFSDEQL